MKLLKLSIVTLFAAGICFTSCKKDHDVTVIPPVTRPITETEAQQNVRLEKVISSTPVTTNIAITTVDVNGDYIANVDIVADGKTATTSSKGYVIMENVTVEEDYVFIMAAKGGYESTKKTITPSRNGLTIVQLMLIPDVAAVPMSAQAGGTIEVDGVSLDFPSNAIADSEGNPYTGTVNVNVVYHDPNDEHFTQTQPGTLVGLTDQDNLVALVSEGMVTVDLTDPQGNPLNVLEGKKVAMQLPASANSPATIDLWHLNETHGIWVNVGEAVKNGNVYDFEVSHFSSYNLDWFVDALTEVCFSIKDQNGNISVYSQTFFSFTMCIE